MPNLPAHIELAVKAAQRLGHSTLDANMGQFLLGSTSPDIRVITRRQRQEYHFAPLDFAEVGAGVDGLFASHPHLRPGSTDDAPTQAFVAGYITHLIVDETWIAEMYRPFFGNSTVFEDDVMGKVMDRALQLELDRQAWESVNSQIVSLAAFANGIDVGFISSETLSEWKDWVVSSLDRGFTWDRLRFMATRIAAGDDGHPAHGLADRFLQSMPASLDQLYQAVPRNRLASFKKSSVKALVQAVGEYLP